MRRAGILAVLLLTVLLLTILLLDGAPPAVIEVAPEPGTGSDAPGCAATEPIQQDNHVTTHAGDVPEDISFEAADENDYLREISPAREWNPEGVEGVDYRNYTLLHLVPYHDLYERLMTYCQVMGFVGITHDEVVEFCDLAISGGYDPRLWAAIAMAESSGGNGSANLYGYCGGVGSEWANPLLLGLEGWREQTAYLHDRFINFYARYVDISDPAQVLWFHHEGEPLAGRDPRSVFYVDNIMTWIEGM